MNTIVIPAGGPEAGPGEVTNLDFFPALSVEKMTKTVRVAPYLGADVVKSDLHLAMIRVNRELAAFAAAQEETGCAHLKDVDQAQYGDTGELVTLYECAVYHTAKAYLLEKTVDTDLTNEGADNAESAEDAAQDSYRIARQAIAAISGRDIGNVELI